MDVEWVIDEIEQLEGYSKRRIQALSAQAISLLRIEGTMRCWRTARGFGCGSIMASVAELTSGTPIT